MAMNGAACQPTEARPDVLMIDNYDSFTYNLVQYLEELGAHVLTRRHDQLTCGLARVCSLQYRLVVAASRPEMEDTAIQYKRLIVCVC